MGGEEWKGEGQEGIEFTLERGQGRLSPERPSVQNTNSRHGDTDINLIRYFCAYILTSPHPCSSAGVRLVVTA